MCLAAMGLVQCRQPRHGIVHLQLQPSLQHGFAQLQVAQRLQQPLPPPAASAITPHSHARNGAFNPVVRHRPTPEMMVRRKLDSGAVCRGVQTNVLASQGVSWEQHPQPGRWQYTLGLVPAGCVPRLLGISPPRPPCPPFAALFPPHAYPAGCRPTGHLSQQTRAGQGASTRVPRGSLDGRRRGTTSQGC